MNQPLPELNGLTVESVQQFWTKLVAKSSNYAIRQSTFTFKLWNKVQGKERIYISMTERTGREFKLGYIDLTNKTFARDERNADVERYAYIQNLSEQLN